MAKSLLIIGNGFDKKCGLLSSFSDYYSSFLTSENTYFSRIVNLIKNTSFINTSLKDSVHTYSEYITNNLTIWDLYFIATIDIRSSNVMWFDVEQEIYDSFHKKIKQWDFSASDFWSYFMHRYKQLLNRTTVYSGFPNTSLDVVIYIMYILSIHRKHPLLKENKKDFDINSFYGYLKKELTIFEKRFSDYLVGQSKDKAYIRSKGLLLNDLQHGITNILNFNYTPIKRGQNNVVTNVHGSLKGKDCIIGIDGGELEYSHPSYQFTKTYRKMEQFVKARYDSMDIILDNAVEYIIFYGHSLNKQDYSYFVSIFDYYDLYGFDYNRKKVSLIFYYSVYDLDKENEIKKRAFTSIINLIHEYDRTYISKHNSGFNLLHKLLIENRIKLFKI